MPKPIICLAEALRQYSEEFRACFSRRQFQYFVTILLALIECQERRTLSALLRTASPRLTLSGLSRFMGRWHWSPQDLATVWLTRFRNRVAPLVEAEHNRLKTTSTQPTKRGRPAATVVTGFLSLDDSVHYKPRGKKMGGLGKHYSNCEKRSVTGHCLFGAVYQVMQERCPLLPRLYCQKATCLKEGRPFLSKIDLAVQTVMEFESAAGTKTHVLVDSWYHCAKLRKATRQKGYDLSGGLKSNRLMRVRVQNEVEVAGSESAAQVEWKSLKDYATGLTHSDWQELWWSGMRGGEAIYAHTLRTKVSKLGATLVVLTKPKLDSPVSQVRYWGSTLLQADAQNVLDCLAKRWAVEVFFEDAKDLLGSDHYQVMRAEAVERFWALIALVGSFLDERRALLSQGDGAGKPHSWGESRVELQAEHRINLLKWLQVQFRENVAVEDLASYLAA
jgi:hypothetical protein